MRRGVQWRKICFGNRSVAGELTSASLLTVTQTCRLQQRNSLSYLSWAISSDRKGLSVPLPPCSRMHPPELLPNIVVVSVGPFLFLLAQNAFYA